MSSSGRREHLAPFLPPRQPAQFTRSEISRFLKENPSFRRCPLNEVTEVMSNLETLIDMTRTIPKGVWARVTLDDSSRLP